MTTGISEIHLTGSYQMKTIPSWKYYHTEIGVYRCKQCLNNIYLLSQIIWVTKRKRCSVYSLLHHHLQFVHNVMLWVTCGLEAYCFQFTCFCFYLRLTDLLWHKDQLPPKQKKKSSSESARWEHKNLWAVVHIVQLQLHSHWHKKCIEMRTVARSSVHAELQMIITEMITYAPVMDK